MRTTAGTPTQVGNARGETSRSVTTTLLTLVAIAITSSGCLGPRVTVLPSGPGVVAEAKASNCALQWFRTAVDRPYDELAALHAAGGDTFKDGPDDFQEALRAKACALGADAIVVTQDYSGPGGTMNVAAIRFREAAADPR